MILPRPSAANRDVSWNGYGFAPASPVTVTVTGEGYRLTYASKTDGFGALAGTFGSTAPAGRYRLALTDGQRTAGLDLQTGR